MMGDRLETFATDRAGTRRPTGRAAVGQILVAVLPVELSREDKHELLCLRQTMPWAPLVVALQDHAGPDAALAAASLAVELSAIMSFAANLISEWSVIVRRLCMSENLDERLAGWLRLQRPHLPERINERISLLVDAGERGGCAGEAAEELGVSLRSLQIAFTRARLAPPARYVQFGRVMPGLLHISRWPSQSLAEAAMMSGYSTKSAFLRAVEASTGARATAARRRVGFEWVADRMSLQGTVDNIG